MCSSSPRRKRRCNRLTMPRRRWSRLARPMPIRFSTRSRR
jgi:hypothetical protein